jgi:hypothetical protein
MKTKMKTIWQRLRFQIDQIIKSRLEEQSPLELGAVLGAIVGLLAIVILLSGCSTAGGGIVALPLAQARAADAIARAQLPELVQHYQQLYQESRGPSEAEYQLWRERWESAKDFYLNQLLPGISSATTFYRLLKDIGLAIFGAI